jgi:hypothetical protein
MPICAHSERVGIGAASHTNVSVWVFVLKLMLLAWTKNVWLWSSPIMIVAGPMTEVVVTDVSVCATQSAAVL